MTNDNNDDETAPAGWGAECDPQPTDMVRLAKTGTVPAFVFGVWAVHRSVPVISVVITPDPKAWSVSHIPSGLSLAGYVAEPYFWDAIRVARALDDAGVLLAVEEFSCIESMQIAQSAVGAALNDHYVWPLTTEAA